MAMIDDGGASATMSALRAYGWRLAVEGDLLARLNYEPWQLDPYPVYAELRAAEPLHRSRIGVLVASRFSVCNEVLRDRRFGQVPVTLDGTLAGPAQSTPSFLQLDPPDHTRLRGLARPAFSPARTAEHAAVIEKTAHELLDRAGGEFDLMADFANQLSIAVIANLLGIPDTETSRFHDYARIVGPALDRVSTPEEADVLRQAAEDLSGLFGDLIRLRAQSPGDDVISQLAAANTAEKLTVAEVLSTCQLLLVAGFETTSSLIGNAGVALLGDPGQWGALCADPELAPKVVEETLRYDPPSQAISRIAKEDVEIAGQRIGKHEPVIVLLGSTGRDEQVFTRPDEFDITRTPEREHLAFASGVHYCLGAPLARLEAAVAFRVLVERLPHLRLAGTPVRRPTTMIRGMTTIPVTATT